MKKYRVVRREPIVDSILAALEESRASIQRAPDPRTAPFEIAIQTPGGEDIELICYAFLANKYRQRGRPSDEHRFQIKYGTDFEGYHQIHVASERNRVTLMFGVHVERGLFIAVDPAMHEWTRFSSSVEFKDEHLDKATQAGWYGWERDRSPARRRQPAPREDLRTEALLALTPRRFLRYVELERLATGIDPGERLLIAQRVFGGAAPAPSQHRIEAALGLSAAQILDVIDGAFRLRAAVFGAAAEHHLGEHLKKIRALSRVTTIDEDGKPDFEVVYKDRLFRIECKNVLRHPSTRGPRVDFQKTRASKGDPCSRYYKASQFEVLAACLHPITEAWDFRFTATSDLESHPTCPGRLSQRVVVAGKHWHTSLEEVLEQVITPTTNAS